MRHLPVKMLMACGLLLPVGLPVEAQRQPPDSPQRRQIRDRDRDQDWSRFHDRYWKWSQDPAGHQLFDHVRSDLDRAWHDANYENRKRISQAIDDVNRVQRRERNDRPDRHALNQTIVQMQRVLNSNRLPQVDRDSLSIDLMRVREYQSHIS